MELTDEALQTSLGCLSSDGDSRVFDLYPEAETYSIAWDTCRERFFDTKTTQCRCFGMSLEDMEAW
jgi:hypothetical protein